MLNIVIPMAGAGSRFSSAGYAVPKPFIPMNGTPMIQVVIRNLRPSRPHRFIFICQQAHIAAYDLRNKLSEWAPGCEVIGLDGITQGAACTVLSAKKWIDNHHPLMIANSDQYVDIPMDDYLARMDAEDMDGIIMTMCADDPKWSFVGLNADQYVQRVEEKKVISNEATVGIYNFRHGSDFISAAEQMIASDSRVNNEFYVAPVYNQLVEQGQSIGIFNIGTEFNGMHGLGTPADLQHFLNSPVLAKATKGL